MTQLQRVLTYDETLLLFMRRHHGPWRTRIMQALTRLGDTESWVALGLVLFAVGTAETIHLSLRLAVAAALATAVVQPLKRLCRRPRPSRGIVGFSAVATDPDAFSFPSGHTAAAFAVAVAFIGEGVGLGPLGVAMAGLIAVSRVYLGAHYPLDVSVGALLGTGAGVLARLLVA